MKYLFYVVVIANLCFFLWEVQQGGLARLSPQLPRESGEKQILLLSELNERPTPPVADSPALDGVSGSEETIPMPPVAFAGPDKLAERLAEELSAEKLLQKDAASDAKDNNAEAPFIAMADRAIDPVLGTQFEAAGMMQANPDDTRPVEPNGESELDNDTNTQPVSSAEEHRQMAEPLPESDNVNDAAKPDDAMEAEDVAIDGSESSDNEEKTETADQIVALDNQAETPITPQSNAGEGDQVVAASEEPPEQAEQPPAVDVEKTVDSTENEPEEQDAVAVVADDSVSEDTPETDIQNQAVVGDKNAAEEVADCHDIGPFKGNRSMRNWLNEHNVDRDYTETVYREVPVSTSWIVIYPAGETMEESKQNVELLKKKGVKDLWLFRKGPMQGMISLGLFSKRSRAEILHQQLVAKDIAAQIKERHKTEKRLFVRVRQEIEIKQSEGLSVFECEEQTAGQL